MNFYFHFWDFLLLCWRSLWKLFVKERSPSKNVVFRLDKRNLLTLLHQDFSNRDGSLLKWYAGAVFVFSFLKIFLRVKISFVVVWKFPLLQRESFYTKCDIANFEVRIRSKTAVERYYQVSPKYAFNIFHLRILDFLDSPKTPHRQYWILLQNNRNRLSLPSVIDQKFGFKKVQTRFQPMTLFAWLIFPTAILQGAFHVSTWQYITLSRNKKEMIFLWSPNTQHREGN